MARAVNESMPVHAVDLPGHGHAATSDTPLEPKRLANEFSEYGRMPTAQFAPADLAAVLEALGAKVSGSRASRRGWLMGMPKGNWWEGVT